MHLYEPADRFEANAEWGANCGPCALAAALAMPVQAVRPFFEGFETRGYCNQTQMLAAIAAAGRVAIGRTYWPTHGVALIQWLGSWMKAPPRVHARYTHWVACYQNDRGTLWLYDVNTGKWQTVREWREKIAPELLRENRGDGWSLKKGFDVELPNNG